MRLRFHGYANFGFIAAAVLIDRGRPRPATPSLVMDVATGNVLYENEATQPWYPASLTKLMTVYVALSAVRDHQISLDTPLVVSRCAASMPPSKMGFRPGTEVTLGNALKMLMVKSPNDIAITIAEGIAGSVEAFADDMNDAAGAARHDSRVISSIRTACTIRIIIRRRAISPSSAAPSISPFRNMPICSTSARSASAARSSAITTICSAAIPASTA